MRAAKATARALFAATLLLVAAVLTYPLRTVLPALVQGTAPDLLWAASFGCALFALTRSPCLTQLGLALALLLEVVQLLPAVPGTFDPLDLGAIALGFAFGVSLARRLTVGRWRRAWCAPVSTRIAPPRGHRASPFAGADAAPPRTCATVAEP